MLQRIVLRQQEQFQHANEFHVVPGSILNPHTCLSFASQVELGSHATFLASSHVLSNDLCMHHMHQSRETVLILRHRQTVATKFGTRTAPMLVRILLLIALLVLTAR
jgi:hypothetical protein